MLEPSTAFQFGDVTIELWGEQGELALVRNHISTQKFVTALVNMLHQMVKQSGIEHLNPHFNVERISKETRRAHMWDDGEQLRFCEPNYPGAFPVTCVVMD